MVVISGDLAVTRWREDPTCDGWGSYVLLSDYSSGAVWSACLQPCGGDSGAHVATFAEGRAEFVRRDDTVTTTLDVAVASDRDAELRRVTIANHGDAARDIALTSYAELVLGSTAGDAAHPAFSKLFVQTEAVEDGRILLATRRRRAPPEPVVWAAHFAVVEGQESGGFEFETDRARFLGRGRTLRNALAMNAAEKHLIRHDDKIALLLRPPFDRSSYDPGYIKGYPPGIRENGGQYTHGAIWSIFAFAALGQGDQAGNLFAILNPIHHSSTPNAVARYKVEPYAACADVYSVAPHVGRGGWTWYTGSAESPPALPLRGHRGCVRVRSGGRRHLPCRDRAR
ncbi:MAG TPA: hypothetical protein VGR65_06875 [Casimicrobiaceae bacterium]|jgi:cellobiose phosphorylase|nr:hypothetical protein [Casimicrobiaceae bacterium]